MNLVTVTFYDPEFAAKMQSEFENIKAAFCKLGEFIKNTLERLAELFEEARQSGEVKKTHPQEREKKTPRCTFIRYSGQWRKHKPP